MNLRRAALALLLLSAAAPASRAAAGNTRLAVLEFEVASDLKLDRTYFSDLARGAVHRAAPQVFVMTRESTEALLAANGKSMSDCTGECEIEVGRKLGADYIVSGRITQVGSRLSLTMRLFSTADGQLVETAEARGRSADELLDHTDAAMESLLAPLANRGPLHEAAGGTASPAPLAAAAPAPAPTPTAASSAAPTASAPPAATAAPALASPARALAPATPPMTPPPTPPTSAQAAAAAPAKAPASPPAATPSASAPPSSSAPSNSPAPSLRAPDASAPQPPAAPSAAASARPAPAAALPSAAESEELQVRATAHSHRWGYAALGAGVVIGGASLAFDNLSSTSKDGKLTAIDFLPVAGYAVALALAGFGVYQLVQP